MGPRLRRGMIIARPLECPIFSFIDHWAIYFGLGEVIEFNEKDDGGIVQCVSLDEFMAGADAYSIVYRPEDPRHGAAICRVAYEALQDCSWDGWYHTFLCNCRHFCVHCYNTTL